MNLKFLQCWRIHQIAGEVILVIDFFTQKISTYVQSEPLLVHLVPIVLCLFNTASCVLCVPQLSKTDTDLQDQHRTHQTLLNVDLSL